MTVLVTGAAGLIGSHVAELALQRGHPVRVMVRPQEDISWLAVKGAEVCRGDMADPVSLREAVRGVDRVIHCAARMGPWGPLKEYEDVNVRGPLLLLEAAVAEGVRRFVHVSTIDVHGLNVGGPASEETPYGSEPDPYCRSKTAGERLIQQMIREKDAPVTVVRPGWTYGPRDTRSFVRFARLVHQGRMILIGPGRNHLPLIYVEDVARGLLLAGDADIALGRTYILVNDERVTQRQYLSLIASEFRVPAPRRQIPYSLASSMAVASETIANLVHMKKEPPLMRFGLKVLAGENRFVIDRARQELKFSPEVPVAEGVRRSIEWLRTSRHL